MPGNKTLAEIFALGPITTIANGDLLYVSRATSDKAIDAEDLIAQVTALASGVTSVALTAPNIFTVGGSPITSTGTLAITLATQAANLVWAGPTNGAAATPTFRALVADDIPSLSSTYQPLAVALTALANNTGTVNLSGVTLTSPTLVTPALGAATTTTLNGLAITATVGGTLRITNGKTLFANDTITLATDGNDRELNIGAGGTLGTAAFTAASAYEVPLTISTGLTRTVNTITANAVNLAGSGSGGVTGTLPIANGGTGSTTAAAVRAALGLNNYIDLVRDYGAEADATYGTPGTGTDISALLQEAVDDIEDSTTAAIVYLRPGVYRLAADVDIPQNVRVAGVGYYGVGLHTGVWGHQTNATIIQCDAGLASAFNLPVVSGQSFYGFTIKGSGNLALGKGINITNGVNFVGEGIDMERVLIEGFQYGLFNQTAPEMFAKSCVFSSNRYNVWCEGIGGAPTDTNVFLNCVTDGYSDELSINFSFTTARGATIIGGDHNGALRLIDLIGGGSRVTIAGINCELIYGTEHARVTAGRLTVRDSSFATNIKLARCYGATASFTGSNIDMRGLTPVSGVGTVIAEVDNADSRIELSEQDYAYAIYTNNTFATLRRYEITTQARGEIYELNETFIPSPATAAGRIGSLGWVYTAVAGTPGGFGAVDSTSIFGGSVVAYTGGVDGDADRAEPAADGMTTKGFSSLNNGSGAWAWWNFAWDWMFSDLVAGDTSGDILIGLLDYNATPTNAIGFRFIKGTDTNIQYVCRSGGTSIVVDSGYAPVFTTPMRCFAQSVESGKVIFTINGSYSQVITTNVPSAVLHPAALQKTTTAAGRCANYFSGFRARMLRLNP